MTGFMTSFARMTARLLVTRMTRYLTTAFNDIDCSSEITGMYGKPKTDHKSMEDEDRDLSRSAIPKMCYYPRGVHLVRTAVWGAWEQTERKKTGS